MKNNGKSHLNQRVITIFVVLSIVLIAFLTYSDILGYFFTADITFLAIDVGRIQSFDDVVRIFTKQYLSGTPYTDFHNYYRPMSALSFSLDYSIWKLNPFGYHLTDLILHTLVSVLIFFLIRLLTNAKQVTAWLSAVIFTTHPILVETVPANPRRVDIIAALFILLSLFLFLKYFSSDPRKKVFLLLSTFSYVLALWAKEIAIILPVLIFAYPIIFSPGDRSFKSRMAQALKTSLPYFIVTFIVLLWRAYVLQDLIGGAPYFSHTPLTIVKKYFIDLLYPVNFLGLSSNIFLSKTISLIALSSLFVFLLFFRRTIFRVPDLNGGKQMRALKVLLITVLVLSLLGLLVYPWISPYIDQIIQQAYNGDGPRILTDAMKGRQALPLEYYIDKVRNLIINFFAFLFLFSLICSIMIHQRDMIKNSTSSVQVQSVVFLLIWLSLPLGIYVLTRTFADANMYNAVIPFSAILSIMIVESFQSISRKIKENFSASSSYSSPLINIKVVSLILTVGLSISLLAYSPLVRTYGEWKDSGNISQMFLNKLSEKLPTLPNDAVIHIYNFPIGISSYKAMTPHAISVCYIEEAAIKSWINLTIPENYMKVVMLDQSEPAVYPKDLDLEIKKGEDNNVVVKVVFDGNN